VKEEFVCYACHKFDGKLLPECGGEFVSCMPIVVLRKKTEIYRVFQSAMKHWWVDGEIGDADVTKLAR